MSRLFFVLLLALCVLVPVLAQDSPIPPRPSEETPAPLDESKLTEAQKANVAVLDAMLGAIRRQFYDRNFAGQNLDALRARFAAPVAESKPGEPLYAVLRNLLAEFKVSHLTIVAPDVFQTNFAPEMNNTTSLRPGLDITELEPGRYFVAAVLDGSAAQDTGVLRGDRIVEIQGKPAAQSPLLADSGGDPGLPGLPHYFIRVPEGGAALELSLQRSAADTQLVAVSIQCTETSMIQATKNSVRVIEHKGRRFGYIHFWHFLSSQMAQTLRAAINNEFKDCDGLIVDLRGRGGSVPVMNACFAPFADPPPMRTRRGLRRQNYNMPRWEKPVVALQDSGSRSAKEVYAHNWKWKNVGPLIGETTSGAVLGSTFVALPDGSRLLLPAQEVRRLTYGLVDLEANPVQPTHPVKDLLAYAQGVDVIKEAGIKVLHGLMPKAEPLPAPAPRDERRKEEFRFKPMPVRRAG